MGKGKYLKYSKEEIINMLNKKEYIWVDGMYKNRDSKISVQDKDEYK